MLCYKRLHLLPAVAALLVAGAAVLTGCDSTEVGREGTLRVLLTDAPFPYDHVAEARVTIDRVEIVPGVAQEEGDLEVEDESGAVLIAAEPRTVNLLELRDGVTAVLGEIDLEAAPYSHVRLHVSEPLILMKDGTEYDLKVPSRVIKILLPAFEVGDEGVTELTLDFDLEHSFVVRGNVEGPSFKGFIFKPVVKAIKYVVNGEGTEIEDETDEEESSSEFEASGEIEALTDSSLTVDGLEILVDGETQFVNVAGLVELSVGDTVEVFYRLEENGDLVALLITLESS